jgi:hypothetical protein
MTDLPIPGRLKPSVPGNKVADLTDITNGGEVYEQSDDGTYAFARVPRNRTLTVDSIAKLRAALANGVVAEVYRVRWHTTKGDKGGGKFFPIDSGEDNNGTVIVGGSLVVQRDCVAINVRMFGAQGNYTGPGLGHDDSAAFAVAIAALPAAGGILYAPDGWYRLTTGFTMRSGVRVKGTCNEIGGSCILWLDAASGYVCHIGELCQNAGLERITLRGTVTPTANDQTWGVKAEGDYPNSSTRASFEKVAIYLFGTGIGANGIASEWQIDNVQILKCQFGACLRGIWTHSQNCSGWAIRDCSVSTFNGGTCIDLERFGYTVIESTMGAGDSSTGTTFVRVGIGAPLTMTSCQAEALKINLITDVGSSGVPITLNDCQGNARTEIRGNQTLILHGGFFNGQILLAGSDSQLLNYGAVIEDLVIQNSSQVAVDGHVRRRTAVNPAGYPAVVNELQLTDTNRDLVLSIPASPSGAFLISCSVRVANAATNVTIDEVHNGMGGFVQQVTLPLTELAVGVHSFGPWLVHATAVTGDTGPIRLYTTAGTANNVFVTATIDAAF